MDKIKISPVDLISISDRAMTLFMTSHSFGGLTQQQMQAYLYAKALEEFLRGKGVEVPFEVDYNTDRNPRVYKVKS